MMNPTRHQRNYRLELEFRRAVREVSSRERRGLRVWLRRYRRRRSRTFHELDPVTGHWRRL